MNKLILILLLLISKLTFGQAISAPYQMSQNQLLSNDAYEVFKTNKFLDYKDKDTLIEMIDNEIYKKTELNNYFGYKKKWNKIENETAESYKQDNEKYNYSFLNDTMIETYNIYGSYNVNREIKVVYNSKGFILNREEKIYVGEDFSENRIIINQFDEKNRVIKIINKTEHKNKVENEQTIIEAEYDNNRVKIKSENGTMICKFIKDENSVGYISKLSPRETASDFMYDLLHKRFDDAKDKCTDKMLNKVKELEASTNQIEDIGFKSGSQSHTDNITINDIWEIKFSTGLKEKYNVEFKMIKQKNGWKIDEFKIEK